MANPQKVGAIAPEITASLDKLKAAAGNAGTTITNLRSQVKQNMTAAEVSQVQGQMDQISDQLNSIAADPTPPPAPTP